MRFLLLVFAVLLVSMPPPSAEARPGLYAQFGIGGIAVRGETVEFDRVTNLSGSGSLTTNTGGGLSAKLALGFNILGYGAIETVLAGHGNRFFDADKRSWGGHWHTGVRLFPLWHWQALLPAILQPLEPSILVAFGTSYQGYVAPQAVNDVGWSRWGTWRVGAGLDYALSEWVVVGVDYSFLRASYNDFIFNYRDDMVLPVSPAAKTGFHQVLATMGVHVNLP